MLSSTFSPAPADARLRQLYEISTFLAGGHTLAGLANGFAQRARELLGAGAVAVRWSGDMPRDFMLLGAARFEPQHRAEEQCLPAAACACGHAHVHGRTRVIPILESNDMAFPHCQVAGYETLVSVPIRTQNQVLGELDLFYRHVMQPSADDMALIEILANHLAGAVQGMRTSAIGTLHKLEPPAGLTPRESEIFLLIAGSRSNKQIARELSIAEPTVKIHVQNIFKKMGVNSRVQIAAMAAGQRSD